MTEPSTENRNLNKLSGVDGWLGILVAILLFISPLLTLMATYFQQSRNEAEYPDLVNQSVWRSVVLLDWTMAVISAVFSAAAGLMLLTRFRRSTVTFSILLIWLSAVGTAVLSFVLADYLVPGSDNSASAGAAMARPVSFSLIWTLYLLNSRRVKNTYAGID